MLLLVIQAPKQGEKMHYFFEQYKWWKIIYFFNPKEGHLPDERELNCSIGSTAVAFQAE